MRLYEGPSHESIARERAPAGLQVAEGTLELGGDVIVTAVNRNPHYLGMVSHWLAFWTTLSRRAGWPITPIVIAVDVPKAALQGAACRNIIWLDTDRTYPSALVSQLVRIIWPGSLSNQSGNVITSDIDMFPLSLRPFEVAREYAEADQAFVVVRNVLEADQQFPICYNVARPATWKAIIGNSYSLGDDLSRVLEQLGTYEGAHGGEGWFSDQEFLYSSVTRWESEGGSVVRLDDDVIRHRRLDRTSKRVRSFLTAPFIGTERWTDFHAYPPSRSSIALNRWLLFWLNRASR